MVVDTFEWLVSPDKKIIATVEVECPKMKGSEAVQLILSVMDLLAGRIEGSGHPRLYIAS